MNRILWLFIVLMLIMNGCGDVQWFPPSAPSVVVTTATLASGVISTTYSQSLTAEGGTTPYTWTITNGALPTGLTLSTSGVISGTPTVTGTSSFTVSVSDASAPALTGTKALSIQINATGGTLTPGQSLIISSGQSVLVPSGTTITANSILTTVTGDNNNIITVAGAFISVPATATGVADNRVSAP